jgi:hypothetical protein
MFRPNCRAIFRLICEQVVCTVDNAFNLRDLVIQEFVTIIAIYTRITIKIEMCHFMQYELRTDKVKLILRYKPEGRGFHSGWCHWIFFH